MTDLPLRKISETPTTITLGWDPVPGAIGFFFYADGVRVSWTADGTRTAVTFRKSAVYRVVALAALAEGTYPSATPPPPPSGFLRGHSSHGKSKDDLSHLRSAARLDAYRDDALFENIFASATANWGYLDDRFRNCSQAGLKTFLVICDYGTQDPDVFVGRCEQVARRYGPNGSYWTANPSLAPVALMLEVWNEPYMPSTYVPPATLAAMTAQAVQRVHAVNGGIKVGPNLDYIDYKTGQDGYTTAFLSAYPAGAAKPDFVASHPYSDPASLGVNTTTGSQKYRFDRILLLRDTLAGKGWTVPMLASEWGWSTADVGEANQASFARQGFELLKQWGVTGGFYYTGDRANTNTADRYSQYGILRPDGTEKPAVAAIGQAQT